MNQDKPSIYVEEPQVKTELTMRELEDYQQRYGFTADEIQQAFVAVGSDKLKLKDFMELKGSTSTSNSTENSKPETAVNPNPGANGNIQPVIENLSPEEIQLQKKAPNNEVTDGEDG